MHCVGVAMARVSEIEGGLRGAPLTEPVVDHPLLTACLAHRHLHEPHPGDSADTQIRPNRRTYRTWWLCTTVSSSARSFGGSTRDMAKRVCSGNELQHDTATQVKHTHVTTVHLRQRRARGPSWKGCDLIRRRRCQRHPNKSRNRSESQHRDFRDCGVCLHEMGES